MIDVPRLLGQLIGLERRTSHPPLGHDDIANAAAGALLMALERNPRRSAINLSFANDGLERTSPWSVSESSL